MPDEKLLSKLKRMTGAKGSFFFFSDRRLNRIARIVSQKKDSDASWDFYFGQTSWIRCKTDRPFAVYLDASFPTYLQVYSEPNKFAESDIERISSQETSWLLGAKKIFFGSNWAKNLTLQQYGLSEDTKRHIVINTGGNIQIPEKDIYDPDKGGLNLLFISLNFEKKGGFICWEAFKLLRCAFPTVSMTIIGQQPPGEVLHTQGVEYAGLLNKSQPDEYSRLTGFLSRASFLVHPTRMDTMGAVILEAGYFGCPSVAPALFGIPDLVKDDVTGCLLDRGFTAIDIADRITSLWKNKTQYLKMRKECRDFTVGELSWDVIGNKMYAHLKEL